MDRHRIRSMASIGTSPAPSVDEPKTLILRRYDDAISYYWATSKHNKRAYKATRYLTVILGALVTLISSLQSAEFIKTANLTTVFAVLTPLLAASLAIVAGASQAFQWGAAWSDMTMTATKLQKERDRVSVTKPGEIDATNEMALFNDVVTSETQGFFQRLLGSGGTAKPDKN